MSSDPTSTDAWRHGRQRAIDDAIAHHPANTVPPASSALNDYPCAYCGATPSQPAELRTHQAGEWRFTSWGWACDTCRNDEEADE